jgi:lipid-A-disaccharide synthase
MSNKPLRFGIVAGEASGDILGAGLIAAIKQQFPDSIFEGIAGPAMIEQGAKSLFPMDRLSVMGIFEVLGRYRELIGIRRKLVDHFKKNPPDVFIGIDAPDFNLGLESKLKKVGIKTVHYVSPSVWAWRQGRVKKIAQSTDLMLTLFPFEAHFYEKHNVPVNFVGHPLADIIPLKIDKKSARQSLSLSMKDEVLAILPGSRSNELHYLAEPFIEAVRRVRDQKPGLKVVVPLANKIRRQQFEETLSKIPDVPALILVDGRSREVMAAADVVLLASGTAALEAMLLKRPMVVAYKLSPFTYWIVKYLVKIKNVSLPNLLAGETLVPEFIQHEATPVNFSKAVLKYFQDKNAINNIHQRFYDIHKSLQQNASNKAADAILKLVENKISHD